MPEKYVSIWYKYFLILINKYVQINHGNGGLIVINN